MRILSTFILLLSLSGCGGVQLVPNSYSGKDKIYHIEHQVRKGMSKQQMIGLLGEPTKQHLSYDKKMVKNRLNAYFGSIGYVELSEDDQYDLLIYIAKKIQYKTNGFQNITVTHSKKCMYIFNSNDELVFKKCKSTDNT